jgi:Mce-associated membrane protein
MNYPPPKSRTNLFAVLAIALVLVAGGVVAIIVSTSGDDDTAGQSTPTASGPQATAAAERDAAIADGTKAAEVFTTIDYTTVEKDLDRWESVSTGDLLTEVRNDRAQSAEAIENAKSQTKGTVRDAALAEFDPAKGTARLLAAIKVDVTTGGQHSTKNQRQSLTLEKTKDGWKASAITTV